jgi:DNA helicase HerA-like ATPase
MKHARAFGVGVVVATQNSMDLDYRTLSNAVRGASGVCRRMPIARVVDGLSGASDAAELASTIKQLAARRFTVCTPVANNARYE